MNMQNYKILVIILLAISITVITSISYAQISEQIPSPKKQLDSGMAPHDVICRDGLVLVESSTNQIECTHETTAQKMGWRVISQPIPILEKTNVSLSNAYNSNEMITTLENPLYSLPAPRNASFNVTFPNSVSINETFVFIEYVWIARSYGTPFFVRLFHVYTRSDLLNFLLEQVHLYKLHHEVPSHCQAVFLD